MVLATTVALWAVLYAASCAMALGAYAAADGATLGLMLEPVARRGGMLRRLTPAWGAQALCCAGSAARGLLLWLARSSAPAARRALGARPLLVVSHPDDEAMFFAPLLTACREARLKVGVLCLSTGDAFGRGEERKVELRESCASLGIAPEDVTVLDDEALRDGMRERWPVAAVEAAARDAARRQRATSVVTFDRGGASGHPNHKATWRGVVELARPAARRGDPPPLPVWALRTLRPHRRLAGPLDAALALGLAALKGALRGGGAELLLAPGGALQAAARAMACHPSQHTLYRTVFVALAAYTRISGLKRQLAPPQRVHRRAKSFT